MMIAHTFNTVSATSQTSAEQSLTDAIKNKVNSRQLRRLCNQLGVDLSGDFGLDLLKLAMLCGADDATFLVLENLGVKPKGCYSNGVPFIAQFIYEGRHREVRANTLDAIQYLVDQGVDINQQDRLGNTPVLLLIREEPKSDYSNYVPALMALGADINKANHKGQTPLEMTLNHRFANNIFCHADYKVKWRNLDGEVVINQNNFRNSDIYKYCERLNGDFVSLKAKLERQWLVNAIAKKQVNKNIKTNVVALKKNPFKI